jgi:hypothetical protein
MLAGCDRRSIFVEHPSCFWLPTCCEDSLVFEVRVSVGDALSEDRSTELGVWLILTPLGCQSRDDIRVFRLVLSDLRKLSAEYSIQFNNFIIITNQLHRT